MTRRRRPPPPKAPVAFRMARSLRPGSYPLERVFPGLTKLPAFLGLDGSPTELRRLARTAKIQIAPGAGYMYVAPHEQPELLRRIGIDLFLSRADCIVVARNHLRRSAGSVLYLDIFHELCHLLQRRSGRDLWSEGYRYADRPTEIEAYRYAVRLGREIGAGEPFLRDYLRVEWISAAEHRELLGNVGVAAKGARPPPTRAPPRRTTAGRAPSVAGRQR